MTTIATTVGDDYSPSLAVACSRVLYHRSARKETATRRKTTTTTSGMHQIRQHDKPFARNHPKALAMLEDE